MTLNFKSLTLFLMFLLGTAAVTASTSQASPQFTASQYPYKATGTGSETFTTPGGALQCSAHYLVENAGGKELEEPTSTVTVTPTYTSCKMFGLPTGVVSMQGCDYVLHANEWLGAGQYSHFVDIGCPGGEKIVITTLYCEMWIPPQGGLSRVTTVNSAGSLTVEPEITELTFYVIKDGPGCSAPSIGSFKGSRHGHLTLSRIGGGFIEVSGV